MDRKKTAVNQQDSSGNPPGEPVERQEIRQKNRREQKNSHVGRKAAGTALILALLSGGGYFGLGIGNPNGGWLVPSSPGVTQEAPTNHESQEVPATSASTQTQAPTQTELPSETPAPEAETTTETEGQEGILTVTVREQEIEYRGRSLTAAELEQALLGDYQDCMRIRLVDDHAIKSVYDEVEALLERLRFAVETAKP